MSDTVRFTCEVYSYPAPTSIVIQSSKGVEINSKLTGILDYTSSLTSAITVHNVSFSVKPSGLYINSFYF